MRKATYTLTYPGGPSTDFDDPQEAAEAFFRANAKHRPAVIKTTDEPGRRGARFVAGTSVVTFKGESHFGKYAADGTAFGRAYSEVRARALEADNASQPRQRG